MSKIFKLYVDIVNNTLYNNKCKINKLRDGVKMRVYIVFVTNYCTDGEYDELLGVFSTEDKAKEWIAKSGYEKDVQDNDMFIRACDVE
jgi:hypothetical protein